MKSYPVPLCLLLSDIAYAQTEDKQLKISPDTADFTTGTSLTPPHHIQIETRVTAQRQSQMHQYSFGETQVRWPLGPSAEIRLDVPPYLSMRDNSMDNGERTAGLDDATLEAKIVLFKGSKSSFGVLLDSILPTGARRVAEHRYQPSASLISSFDLSEKATLSATLGGRHASDEDNRFSQYFAANSLRYDVKPKTTVYGEVFGFNRRHSTRDARNSSPLESFNSSATALRSTCAAAVG